MPRPRNWHYRLLLCDRLTLREDPSYVGSGVDAVALALVATQYAPTNTEGG